MIQKLLEIFEREKGEKKAKRYEFRSGGSDVYIMYLHYVLLERPLTSWLDRMRERGGERERGRERERERERQTDRQRQRQRQREREGE